MNLIDRTTITAIALLTVLTMPLPTTAADTDTQQKQIEWDLTDLYPNDDA